MYCGLCSRQIGSRKEIGEANAVSFLFRWVPKYQGNHLIGIVGKFPIMSYLVDYEEFVPQNHLLGSERNIRQLMKCER